MSATSRTALAAAAAMWLASLACHDADGDLPRAYRTMAIPSDLTSPSSAGRGGALFRQYCVLCHGRSGDGRGLQSAGLDPKPRDLTDPAWQQAATPRHVFFAIREGVHGTAMPSWRSLGDEDIWKLTGYVLSLGRR